MQGKILPNMGDNIKCGNSLIGSDYWEGEQFELMGDRAYFRSINTFDWERAFPAVFAATVKPVRASAKTSRASVKTSGTSVIASEAKQSRGTRDCFTGSQAGRNRNDGAATGFDCVIGNPPYVGVELMSAESKEYYRTHYKCFFKRADIFSVFIRRH